MNICPWDKSKEVQHLEKIFSLFQDPNEDDAI